MQADDHGDDADDDELVADAERLLGQDDDGHPAAVVRDRERLAGVVEGDPGLGQLQVRGRARRVARRLGGGAGRGRLGSSDMGDHLEGAVAVVARRGDARRCGPRPGRGGIGRRRR